MSRIYTFEQKLENSKRAREWYYRNRKAILQYRGIKRRLQRDTTKQNKINWNSVEERRVYHREYYITKRKKKQI